MLSINTNLSSLIVQNSMKQSTNKLNQAIERLTTGFKINHAKDNAANYNIATNMTTKIGSYNVAEDNCAMGLDLLATAEGSLNLIQDKLTRLRSLAVTAQNGTYGAQSLEALETEAESIVSEIKREYSTAEYNGQTLFAIKSEEDGFSDVVIDEERRVSNVNTFVANETYYLTDSTDLLALQNLTNSGVSTSNIVFELMNDIDMEGVVFSGIGTVKDNSIAGPSCEIRFEGTFHGNGHVIKNLEIKNEHINATYVGLFRGLYRANIDSLGIENCNISGQEYVGALAGYANSSTVTNCWATGSVSYQDAGALRANDGYIGGLFGSLSSGNIEFCCSNCNVQSSEEHTGGFAGIIYGATISNCYSTGFVDSGMFTGGFAGNVNDGTTITNCYSLSNIDSGSYSGGFIGEIESKSSSVRITNCYSSGNVDGWSDTGGFIGRDYYGNTIVNNCYTTSSVTGNGVGGFLGNDYSNKMSGSNNYCNNEIPMAVRYGAFSGVESKSVEEIKAICTPESMGFTEANGWQIVNGTPRFTWEEVSLEGGEAEILAGRNIIELQVGIGSNKHSTIAFDVAFDVEGVDVILSNSLTDINCIFAIDNMLHTVANKATEYGAVQNRLESVLEEIVISRDNLISSRSTLRDADIAEVSSEYIRQQILQQASATLLATANQSASIALSLI